jgi:hypothetical protein
MAAVNRRGEIKGCLSRFASDKNFSCSPLGARPNGGSRATVRHCGYRRKEASSLIWDQVREDQRYDAAIMDRPQRRLARIARCLTRAVSAWRARWWPAAWEKPLPQGLPPLSYDPFVRQLAQYGRHIRGCGGGVIAEPQRAIDSQQGRFGEQGLRDRCYLLVGVAKRSAVIHYLAVGLGVSAAFAGSQPAYLPIAEELEREAAPAQYRWVGQRSMGQLYLARLDRGDGVPLMPVDVAAWQVEDVGQVMTLLHQSSRASFPLRGYPQELIAAHQQARLSYLETEMLESLLMEQVQARNPIVADRVRQLRLLGRRLVEEMSDGPDAQE